MKMKSEPIIFFGSGPVAAKSLQFLHEHFYIQAVITKPLPPHHHEKAPVAKLAEEFSIKIYYVRDKNELKDLFEDRKIIANIRLGVLVDFGIIIPQFVLDAFKLGIINSHFSLLPEWRGADPITFAVLSGQPITGVSLMRVVRAMDEGPLLAQEPYELSPSVTTPDLTDALIKLSNRMLLLHLPTYMSGELLPVEQDKRIAPTYSRKLTKNDGQINWEKSAEKLEREIRAFAGWPKSHAIINGIETILTVAHTIDTSGVPGQFDSIDRQLVVHCSSKSLIIDRLKPAGKSEMSGADFLRGYLKKGA
jgi:methionyl-tRNA formyltransferase